MVIIMLSLNKKLKQIQTSIKREVYSASGRNTSLSYNTQNHMNIIVYKKLTFYTFVSSPVTESIINPLTIISSGINGCSIIVRTVPFTDFTPELLTSYVFESTREKELVFSHKTTYDGPIIPSEELDGGRFWSLEEIRNNIGKEIFTPNFENEFQKLGF